MTTHTEKEARETWCPWVQFFRLTNDSGATNRGLAFESSPMAACIASKCAMWDWSGSEKHYGECGLKRGKA